MAQRWRSEAGEIDIIVRAGNEIVFVEVKTSRNFERAASRITRQQQARIYRSAEVFLGTQPQGLLTPARFDVALVDGTGAIEIIENAFGHE